MGVKGLWSLLGPGKPIDPRELKGKILAVDLSIWLYKVILSRENYFFRWPEGYLGIVGHKIVLNLITFYKNDTIFIEDTKIREPPVCWSWYGLRFFKMIGPIRSKIFENLLVLVRSEGIKNLMVFFALFGPSPSWS